jgi:hypothetical protein
MPENDDVLDFYDRGHALFAVISDPNPVDTAQVLLNVSNSLRKSFQERMFDIPLTSDNETVYKAKLKNV